MPGGRVRLRHPVYFVRHGQTDWNAAKRFQGHSDIPLNDAGRAQAARNGLALRAHEPSPETMAFFVSPLARTRETMEIVRSALNLPRQRYQVDDRLIELDLGVWNGRTPEEIAAEDPDGAAAREADKWGYRMASGESYAAAAPRIREFLTDLKAARRRRPVLVVGHGGSGRRLRGYLRGLSTEETPHLEAPQHVVLELADGREREI
ncbi:MAG: histidine phosphatase family protein [Parvularculaceae bacterium]